MFTSGVSSHLSSTEELVYIKEEADLVLTENDQSSVESSDLMTTVFKIKNGIKIEVGEGETANYTDASLESFYSAPEGKEYSITLSSVGNPVFGQKLVNIKKENDSILMQNDLSEPKFYGSASATMKIEEESTSEDETSRSGKNDFFSKVTEQLVKMVKIEKNDFVSEDAVFMDRYSNSLYNIMDADSTLHGEEDMELEIDAPQTLVHPFEEPKARSDYNNRFFETVEIFDEADDSPENEIFPQVCESPFTAESESGNHSSESDANSCSAQYRTCDIELIDISLEPEDSCPKNVTNTSNGCARKKQTRSKSRKPVPCSWEYKPPSETKGTENRNSIELSGSEKYSKVSPEEKWVLCTFCPAGFKFLHSLTKHLAGIHNVHVCIKCLRKFRHRIELERHLKFHPTVNEHRCVFCSLECKTESELRLHVRIHSRYDKLFSCSRCFTGFDKSTDLLVHVSVCNNKRCSGQSEWQEKVQTKNKIKNSTELIITKESSKKCSLYSMWLSCGHCPAQFAFRHHLKNHVAGGHLFSCFECSDKFKGLSDLHTHQKTHPAKEWYPCTLCSASFRTEKTLRIHAHQHRNVKAFSCARCSVDFYRYSDLLDHLLIHTTDVAFTCLECLAKFKGKAELDQHSATHRIRDSIWLSCSHCLAQFKFRHHLKYHVREKHEFSCWECADKFTLRSDFETHRKIHPVEEQYSCTICQSSFRTEKKLKIHAKSHWNVKAFSCAQCFVDFARCSILLDHLSTHTPDVSFSCVECFAKFRSKADLDLHSATHQEILVLDDITTDLKHSSHLMTLSDEQEFMCMFCPAKLKSKSLLRQHVKSHSHVRTAMCSLRQKAL